MVQLQVGDENFDCHLGSGKSVATNGSFWVGAFSKTAPKQPLILKNLCMNQQNDLASKSKQDVFGGQGF